MFVVHSFGIASQLIHEIVEIAFTLQARVPRGLPEGIYGRLRRIVLIRSLVSVAEAKQVVFGAPTAFPRGHSQEVVGWDLHFVRQIGDRTVILVKERIDVRGIRRRGRDIESWIEG